MFFVWLKKMITEGSSPTHIGKDAFDVEIQGGRLVAPAFIKDIDTDKTIVEEGVPLWQEKWIEIQETDWETDLGVLVISGKPGSGTSSAAKILANLYGAELYKAGDTVRELTKTEERAGGFMERTEDVDHYVDERVRQYTANAQKGKPVIVEAQIGGLTAHDVVQNKFSDAPIIRILFWATLEERVRRLKLASDEETREEKIELAETVTTGTEEEVNYQLRRQLERRFGEIEQLTDDGERESLQIALAERVHALETGSDEVKRNLLSKIITEIRFKTQEQIRKKTLAREHGDNAYWKKLYPGRMGEENPLNKNAHDANGEKIYSTEAFDNTDWKTPERSAYEVHKFLAEMGIVRPKRELKANEEVTLTEDQAESGDNHKVVNPF